MAFNKNKIILALILVVSISRKGGSEVLKTKAASSETDQKASSTSREAKTIETLHDISDENPSNIQDIQAESRNLGEGKTIDTEITEEGGDGESIPVPEPFIGGSRKPTPQDILREKMIGLIFTGKPEPLGPRQNRIEPPNRRYFRPRPGLRNGYEAERRWPVPEGPKEILKPMSFVPRPANIEFASASRPHEYIRGPPHASPPSINFRPEYNQNHRLDRRPIRPYKRYPPQDSEREASVQKDIFSNNVGPDFGPVTYEEFGSNFANSHKDFDPHEPHKRPFKPFSVPVKPIYHSSSKPPKHPIPAFGYPNTIAVENVEGPQFESYPSNEHETCQRYTEDICLDADNYPHQEILQSLSLDPTRSRTLIAEVRDQSADDLVDGISAAQEARYDYSHYFGNRREDTINHRDFAEDGGYLCPSEVKYARPKRARNSKGEWKFIVNMDKYSQTIRMEKCMKPGGSCSYVSHHYRATCNQIYNYQRLLSWEKERGLHMDIFKVPSCCSCHIQGYAYVFPPLYARDKEHFSGSERIDRIIPIDPNKIEEINLKAPPYSPVNYPNLPVSPENRNNDGRKRARSRERNTVVQRLNPPPRRSYSAREGSVKRSNNPDHRVNYDYHPIIDFFEAT